MKLSSAVIYVIYHSLLCTLFNLTKNFVAFFLSFATEKLLALLILFYVIIFNLLFFFFKQFNIISFFFILHILNLIIRRIKKNFANSYQYFFNRTLQSFLSIDIVHNI